MKILIVSVDVLVCEWVLYQWWTVLNTQTETQNKVKDK